MKTGPFLKAAAEMLQPGACEEEDELRRYMAEASVLPVMNDVALIARLTATLDSIANGRHVRPGIPRRELTAAECRTLAREALGLPDGIDESTRELCHA